MTADIDLTDATLDTILAAFTRGSLTSEALAAHYLERIQAIDQTGPALRSVLELNPDALTLAAQADRARRVGPVRGPLHGVPVLLKGNIDTADGMSTTAGSLALAGVRPAQDAFLVTQLRAAGAIILGKTNLSEWANFRSSASTSGWSSLGGQTRHPYALDRNPSGSSSGAAVAVAADLCPLSVGTETDGSIVSPAGTNGVVGLKPTLGLISRAGIIPIAHSQDTAGPLARTVKDAAWLLGALVGGDPRDPITQTGATQAGVDYTRYCRPDGLQGARLGLARAYMGRNGRVDALVQEAVLALQAGGATVIEVDWGDSAEYAATEWEVLLYEFKADLNQYLAGLGPAAPVKSLTELVAFNQAHRSRVMPYFGQELFLQAEARGDLSSEAYRTALATNRRLAGPEGIDRTLADHQLDALIAPSNGPAWLTDCVNGDCHHLGSSTPAAVAGYPNLTLPIGHIWGLPIGLSFIGPAFSEPTLIRLAYALEQIMSARRPPDFRPMVDLAAGP